MKIIPPQLELENIHQLVESMDAGQYEEQEENLMERWSFMTEKNNTFITLEGKSERIIYEGY